VSVSAQLILLALLCTGYSDFLYKKAQSSGVSVAKFMTMQSAAFITVQIVCCIIFGFQFSRDLIVLGLMGGMFAFVSFGLLYRSMRDGDASVNATIFRMGFIFTSGICEGMFGEAVAFDKMIGSAGAIGAIALISLAPGARWSRLSFPILAAVAFGFLRFLHRSAGLMGVSPWSLLLVQSIVFQVCTQVARRGDPMKGIRQMAPETLFYAPACGFLLASAAIACILAFRTGEASVLAPVAQLGFLVTTPMAVFALNERFDVRKALGLALAVCSVVVLLK